MLQPLPRQRLFLVQAPWRTEIHPTSWGWYLKSLSFLGVFHMNPCKSHVEPLYWGYFFVGTAAKKYAKYRPKWHTRVTATTWSLEPSLLYKDRPWQAKVSRLIGVKESFPTICWLLLLPPWKELTSRLLNGIDLEAYFPFWGLEFVLDSRFPCLAKR